MNGWMGTILRVDLTEGKISKEIMPEELAHTYIGGRGLNARVLYDEVKPGTDPLGADNKLIIGVGPCNGTLVPGSQRFTVTFKSPITGRYGDSNSGGSFGATLKYAGYDMVIIEGQAKEPVYLWIDEDRVEIRSARHLWGKTTREASRQIMTELQDPEISTLVIGPGGENLVRFASVIADLGRALGRAGVGAVFGSKNLKAVSVRGSKGVKVAHPGRLEEAVRQTYDAWNNNRTMYDLVAGYGPSRGALRYGGMLGDKNFSGGQPTGWFSMMSYENQSDRYVKTRACFSCSQGCDHMYVVTRGPFKGTYGEGIELSQPMDYGVKVGLYDFDAVLAMGTLGDEMGLDYFDSSSLMAYAVECFEKGILTEKDTDGLRLEWGNQDALPKTFIDDCQAGRDREHSRRGPGESSQDNRKGNREIRDAGKGNDVCREGSQELEGLGVDVCGFQPGALPCQGFSSGVDAGPRMGRLAGQDPQEVQRPEESCSGGREAGVGLLVREPRRFQKFP